MAKIVFSPKLSEQEIKDQYLYCLNHESELDWKDLIEKSKVYLTKNHEVGGQCKIDIKTGEVKVSIEKEGSKSHVGIIENRFEYGPIEFHTHPFNPFPSYPDLLWTLYKVRSKEVYLWVIIYKGDDGEPCLLIYKPNLKVFNKLLELGNDGQKYCYETLVDVDQKSRELYDLKIFKDTQINSIKTRFDITYIGTPRKSNVIHPLVKWLPNLKRQLSKEEYSSLRSIIKKRYKNWKKKIGGNGKRFTCVILLIIFMVISQPLINLIKNIRHIISGS